MSVTHCEPAPDVSDEEESVVLEVAHHGVAAAQFCGPSIPLVVVADGAITNHSQNKGEDPLVVTEEKGRNECVADLTSSSSHIVVADGVNKIDIYTITLYKWDIMSNRDFNI